jgi:uncharacterized protein YutD
MSEEPVYEYCPYGCGHFEKADTRTGKASGKIAVHIKMSLHKGRCPNRPKTKKKKDSK